MRETHLAAAITTPNPAGKLTTWKPENSLDQDYRRHGTSPMQIERALRRHSRPNRCALRTELLGEEYITWDLAKVLHCNEDGRIPSRTRIRRGQAKPCAVALQLVALNCQTLQKLQHRISWLSLIGPILRRESSKSLMLWRSMSFRSWFSVYSYSEGATIAASDSSWK